MCDTHESCPAPEKDETRQRVYQKKELTVNGLKQMIIVDGEDRLVDVIRSQLGLTGTKVGCRAG
ncbi:MAG: hypothetical protein M0O96_11260 [Desulforhopalus sp.]|nr:hypothetical protein [Desulforhopalus sp.]